MLILLSKAAGINEPWHVKRDLSFAPLVIHQTHMHNHTVEPDVWLFVWASSCSFIMWANSDISGEAAGMRMLI